MKRIIELLGLGVSILLLMTASAFAAKGYNCVFPSGKVHTFENDVFQEDNASQLAFKIGK